MEQRIPLRRVATGGHWLKRGKMIARSQSISSGSGAYHLAVNWVGKILGPDDH